MLKIRLQRTGRINLPSYRLIVVEHTEGPRTGKFVEKVGSYNPRSKERTVDAERVKYWMSVGAKPSDTVHNMFVSLGILNAPKINVLPKYVEPVKPEEPAAAETAAEAAPDSTSSAEEAAPETAEAPIEASPSEEAAA